MDNIKDYIIDLLEEWLETRASYEVTNFLEKETGLKILNCEYDETDFGFNFKISSNLSIQCFISIRIDFITDSKYYTVEDYLELDDIQKQYDILHDETEFNNYLYQIFTDYFILGHMNGIDVGSILDCDGSYITIKIDEKNWTTDKINTILNIFSKFNNICDSYIEINDESLDYDMRRCDNITKNKLIEFLINNNWLDINNCFDKDTVSMIYENTLNTYIDDFVQELFSNKELQEDFHSQINNTLLTMLKNNEIEIEK